MKKFAGMLVLVVALALASSSFAFAAPPQRTTIVDVAVAANSDMNSPFYGDFDILISLVANDPAVLEKLTGNGQMTVFAPTDDAFAALFQIVDPATLTPEIINEVLLYHVSPGRRYAADVLMTENLRMLSKGFTYPYVMNANAYLRDTSPATTDAQIIATDIEASNGVIHVIDQVLVP